MDDNKNIDIQAGLIANSTEDEAVEKELIDVSDLLMEKPFDPTKINIETKTPSLDTLIKRIERTEIQMDTTTYFQRQDDLWDVVKQSRLIESGFLQAAFVHPSLVQKYKLKNGQAVKGKMVRSYNAEKKTWGWKVFEVV